MTARKLFKRMFRAIARNTLALGAWQLPHGAHMTRYSMYRELDGVCDDQQQGKGKQVLCISHSTELAEVIGLKGADIVEANYPEHNIIDLEKFDDEQFDYIVSDQVLEHIEGDPRKAFDESLRVMKPGGVAIHTTCFINPIHGAPSDFWRFTPNALKHLASDFSEIIKVGGWGNPGAWVLSFLGLRFAPIPHLSWHPLHRIATKNNEKWPIVTWIVARK